MEHMGLRYFRPRLPEVHQLHQFLSGHGVGMGKAPWAHEPIVAPDLCEVAVIYPLVSCHSLLFKMVKTFEIVDLPMKKA